MIKKLVALEDVKKTYQVGETKVCALRGVDLTIEEGEFLALTGASGSGKSTLLHLIGGLHQPTEGQVFLEARISPRCPEMHWRGCATVRWALSSSNFIFSLELPR